ncbi:YhdP family protein [Thalassolituus oleivorans]|uniref:YhdP family protein n=1 Tax=Thalassolituus oleivorans TaxID=187493 RepID=UPI0023F14D28|nr:YhdP family protein [Thalassolituus oleivorans]
MNRFRSIWTQIWITIVVAMVALALYTSLGRQLIPLIETFKPDLERVLSEQLKQPVTIRQLRGDWNLLSPVVHVDDLSIGDENDGLVVTSIEAELDLSATAFYRLPVFKRINIDGASAAIHQTDDGAWFVGEHWQIVSAATDEQATLDDESKKNNSVSKLVDWLELQQSVILSNWSLQSHSLEHDEQLEIKQLVWRNQGQDHALEGTIAWGREQLADIFVSAALEGPLWPWGEQHGEVYLRVDNQEWTRWIPNELPQNLHVSRFEGGAEGWLSIRDGDLNAIYVAAKIPALHVETGAKPLNLNNGSVLASGIRTGSDWHVRVLPEFDEPLPFSQLRVSSVSLAQQKGFQIAIPDIDIRKTGDFILRHDLLPERFSQYVDNIAPEGKASDVRVAVLPSLVGGEPWKVDIRANLAGLSTQPFHGIPSFDNAEGKLHLQPNAGVVAISDPTLTMHLPDIYQSPWDLTDVSANFYWKIEPEFFRLKLDKLRANLEGTPVHGDLAMRIPRRDTDVEYNIALMLGVAKAPQELQTALVPDILDPAINEFLDNGLDGGTLQDVGFVLNGHVGSDVPHNSLTTQLYLAADDVKVTYLDEWPAIEHVSGRVLLDAPNVDIWIDQGQTLGGDLLANSSRVRIRDTKEGTQLNVVGQIAGDAGEGMRYFTETPIQTLVDHAFDQWQANGQIESSLRLQMLLGKPDSSPSVQLDSQLTNARLRLGELDLELAPVNGTIHFSTEEGLSSKGLTAGLLGGSFAATMKSTVVDGGFDIHLDGSGKATWQDFKQWMPVFLLDPISGELNYQASLDVRPASRGGVQLDVESDLVGTLVDLPFPAGKLTDTPRSLIAQIKPSDITSITLNYDDFLRAELGLGKDGVDRGHVTLDGTEPVMPDNSGIIISGTIDETLDAEPWFDVWNHMMALLDAEPAPKKGPNGRTVEAAPNPVESIDITLSGLNAWDIPMGITRIAGRQDANDWTLQVDSDVTRGTVVIHPGDKPIVMLLDYIHMPEEEAVVVAEGDDIPETVDPLQDLDPAVLPALDMTLQELYVGTRNYGRWQITSRPSKQGLTVNILDSDMKGLNVSGKMDWNYTDGIHDTRLYDMTIKGSDIGKVQRAFRQSAAIEGKDLQSTLALNWQGSPLGFDTETLQGDVSVRIKDGSLQAEGTGALRAFGALNFNSIARRLRLDFSDIYQSGLAFDTLKGKAKIEAGLLTLSEPLSVEGPGGKFLTSGATNLNTGDLDMKLAVTFPVTSTLPLVAVLAGFAPPIAASVYVTEKLIGDELERFTSASYDVKGTWQQPMMEINQAFDNQVDGKKKRGIKSRIFSVFNIFNIFGSDDE